jgi:hypothetical protein
MLTQLWASGELFHTATGTAYADLLVDGHRETWPIRSSCGGRIAAPTSWHSAIVNGGFDPPKSIKWPLV